MRPILRRSREQETRHFSPLAQEHRRGEDGVTTLFSQFFRLGGRSLGNRCFIPPFRDEAGKNGTPDSRILPCSREMWDGWASRTRIRLPGLKDETWGTQNNQRGVR